MADACRRARRSRRIAGCAAWLLLTTSAPVASAAEPVDWQAKVDPWVAAELEAQPGGDVEVLVVLAEQADLSAASTLHGKNAKGRFVVDRLRETAARTQAPLLAELQAKGAPYQAFWVVNAIWTRADAPLVETLARRADVAHLAANPRVRLQEPATEAADARAAEPTAVEWNIAHVRAPEVWATGVTGQGVVVGNQDTGVDWDHPAIRRQYRGWNGSSADHNYNWHDAIHSVAGTNLCGINSAEPCDDNGHGTLTTGVAVGSDGGANQIGMAPGAQWIGCRNMDRGVGTPATYIECFQFFLAPTDLAGNNPDPDRAPDVLNNSWRCPTSEGCTNPDVLRAAVENARAAGIVVVASAGNDGPACSSINAPPAIYDAAFTVGATADPSSEDGIDAPARFSSRGPIAVDGSNRLKPDVSAPGQWIRSSDLGGTYRAASGTSLSGPHVTGLVALMIAADPNLAGEVDQIEEQIRSGAAQPATTTNEVCGGIAISSFPNHTYGYGRIDAVASISPVPEFRLSARPSTVETCAPAEAQFTVELARFEGFAEAVTLSAAGAPPGTSALFAANPLTPPASTTLTIGGTGAAAGGVYALTITGTANPSGMERHGEVTLRLFAGPPPPPALSAPANGAANLEQQPLLVWSAIAAATQYQVEVANDAAFADLVYSATTAGTSLGVATPLVKGRRYFWRVRGSNLCGAGTPATAFSFTTRSQARLLLVDEDDGAPDVRPLWEQALQSLGREYDVWNAGGAVLGSADLAPYDTTVWFTGARTGDAGPGSEESAIASWLAAGRRCFFISSRDYFASGRISAFMQNQLGAAEIDSDGSYSAVAGAAPLFGDLGSLPLAPPLGSFGDLITPGARTTTTFAAAGGAAGVRRDAGSYRTHYFAFAWEALDTATRREVLRRVLADCATVTDRLFNDGFESGSTSGWLRP